MIRRISSGSRPAKALTASDGLEIGEGLDTVSPVDVDPAHVPELGAELLDEAPDDVGPRLEHPVLDGGQDGGRQEPGGLPVLPLERDALASEVQSEEGAEAEDQDADDECQDLGPEPFAEEAPGHHAGPPASGRLTPGRRGRVPGPAMRLGRGSPRPEARYTDLAYTGVLGELDDRPPIVAGVPGRAARGRAAEGRLFMAWRSSDVEPPERSTWYPPRALRSIQVDANYQPGTPVEVDGRSDRPVQPQNRPGG